MIRRAAITALVTFRVVQVAVTILDVLVARLIRQVVSQTTVSVIVTIFAIDAVHFIGRIAYVVIVSSGCTSELTKGILYSFSKGLLESRLPDWRFRGSSNKGDYCQI